MALKTIVLNLKQLKTEPLKPSLFCINSMGPLDVNFIKIPNNGINHERIKTITSNEKTISKTLLINILNELSRGNLLILMYGTVEILEIKKVFIIIETLNLE